MSYETFKKELLEDPEVREAYERLPLTLTLARAVVERRREMGISQEELAEQMGTSQAQVWRIESGQGNPQLATLEKLRSLLGLRVDIGPAVIHEESEQPSAPVELLVADFSIRYEIISREEPITHGVRGPYSRERLLQSLPRIIHH